MTLAFPLGLLEASVPSAGHRSFSVSVLGALQAPIECVTLEGGYTRRQLSGAAQYTGKGGTRVWPCRCTSALRPGSRSSLYVQGTGSTPASPSGLALLSKKPNLSRLETPLLRSVETLLRAPSRHSSKTSTPIPSGIESGFRVFRGFKTLGSLPERLFTRAPLTHSGGWADLRRPRWRFSPSALIQARCSGGLRPPFVCAEKGGSLGEISEGLSGNGRVSGVFFPM